MTVFAHTFKKEVLTLKVLLFSIIVSFIYFSISIYVLNYRLVWQTTLGNFSLFYKLKLMIALLGGVWTAFTPSDVLLSLVTAILVGLNVVLLLKTITQLRESSTLRLSVGGSSIVGIVATGCSTCGFSILSLLGITAGVGMLPYALFSLHLLAIGLLAFSCLYILQKMTQKAACKIR